MPDQRGERAKQQIRELGQAARQVDRSYPNTKQGDRIVSGFRHQANRIGQNSRQGSNRSLGGSHHDSDLSHGEILQIILFLVVSGLTVCMVLILIFLL